MAYIELRKNEKGRGVYATKVFIKGDHIEDAPVIVVPINDIVRGSILDRYTYEWGRSNVAIALGFGMLYNHSYTPNMKYKAVFKLKVMRLTAIRTILDGDELTINYNGDPDCTHPVPFDVK